ncbi:hypothetical protein J1N35_026549 [Gossypium stocksii]|uniref:Uncharacterized protein n=1 Tax=Gossypium stocksii TaxID=47602 RepID=A0A9D3ZYR1_9ROSI|nr:hypothetical protein J1N35_026549 [Gossypium stocksii]
MASGVHLSAQKIYKGQEKLMTEKRTNSYNILSKETKLRRKRGERESYGANYVAKQWRTLVEESVRIGCILLSVGQDEFHGEMLHTLKYVVNQSNYTVQILNNVTQYLSLTKAINVAELFLPSNVITDIDKLNINLNVATDTLIEKTDENVVQIRRVFNAVRLVLISVAAVMLILALLGLLLSVLGHQHAVHIFIVSGWLLVAIIFILCGVVVILNNVISDTCLAMGECMENLHAETTLSNILPCVDQRTTNDTLT